MGIGRFGMIDDDQTDVFARNARCGSRIQALAAQAKLVQLDRQMKGFLRDFDRVLNHGREPQQLRMFPRGALISCRAETVYSQSFFNGRGPPRGPTATLYGG